MMIKKCPYCKCVPMIWKVEYPLTGEKWNEAEHYCSVLEDHIVFERKTRIGAQLCWSRWARREKRNIKK